LKNGYESLKSAIRADNEQQWAKAVAHYSSALELLGKVEDNAKNNGMPIVLFVIFIFCFILFFFFFHNQDKAVGRRIDESGKRVRDIEDALPFPSLATPLTPHSSAPFSNQAIVSPRFFLIRTAITSVSNYKRSDPNANELSFCRGMHVYVILQIEKWCWIDRQGKRGWISAAHLKETEIDKQSPVIRTLLFDSKYNSLWNPYPIHDIGYQATGGIGGAQQIQVGIHSIGQREAIDCFCFRDVFSCSCCINHCCGLALPTVRCIQHALALCCSVFHGNFLCLFSSCNNFI
jgi:hypothetical protein